jgi:hypothetical protein
MATRAETHGTGSPTEESPLLGSVDPAQPPLESAEEDQHWVSAETRYRVVFLTLMTAFIFTFASNLLQGPLTSILETRICDDLYREAAESERDCKSPAVQGELASLSGWIATLECVPGK